MSDQLGALRREISEFVRARDWEQFHDAKNLAMCLAAEVGELVAELRWVASSEVGELTADEGVRQRLKEELGDVMISLQMLADRLEMDLVTAAREKVTANALKYPADLVRGRAERP